MELEVKVTDASLGDVVGVVFDGIEETVTTTTLGDVVVDALLRRLAADPRWDRLAERFWDAVDERLDQAAPGYIEELVAKEVARQLTAVDSRAMVRGKPATRAEAMVAVEVTTQLRAQFTPAVDQALATVRADLEAVSRDAVQAFRTGLAHGQPATWPRTGDGGA